MARSEALERRLAEAAGRVGPHGPGDHTERVSELQTRLSRRTLDDDDIDVIAEADTVDSVRAAQSEVS